MRDYPIGNVVETVNGVQIHLNVETGRFEARVGRQTIRRKSLPDIRRAIGSRAVEPVELVVLPWSWRSGSTRPYGDAHKLDRPNRTRVVEITHDGRYRTTDGDLLHAGTELYHDDPELYAAIEDIRRRRDEFVDGLYAEWRAILERYRPFEGFPEPEPATDGRILPKRKDQP